MKNESFKTALCYVCIVCGILLMAGNRLALGLIAYMAGAVLFTAAVYGITQWLRYHSDLKEADWRLAGWLAMGGTGMWAVLDTSGFIFFLNVLLGLAMIVHGALSLYQNRIERNIPVWVLSAAELMLGLIIACRNPEIPLTVFMEGAGMILTAMNRLTQKIMTDAAGRNHAHA